MAEDIYERPTWTFNTVELPVNLLETRSKQDTEKLADTAPDLAALTPADERAMARFFAHENELLACGSKHLFVKIGHVRLKVRALFLNENNPHFLTLMIDDEREDVWVNVPHWWRFETAYGNQRFVW